MVGFVEVSLIVLMLASVLVWVVLITFLWWELLQFKRIRCEMEELPQKLAQALKFIEDTGGVSNNLKEEVVPMIMGACSDLKVTAEDMRGSVDTILQSLKTTPHWVDGLVTGINMNFNEKINSIEKSIQELKR